MSSRVRLVILLALLAASGAVSAWVNVPPWLTRRSAQEHYRLGLKNARAGNSASALAEWRIATRIDPDYPQPYRRIGDYLLNKADRPDLAAAVYSRLVAIDPGGPHIYCNLAKCLAVMNEIAEATQSARAAVRAEPDCALAHNILGVLLMTGNQMKQGLTEMERAHELAPANNDFSLVLTQAFLDVSDLAAAQRTATDVIARDPGNSKAHFLLAYALARGPRTPANVSAALSNFSEAAHLQPGDAETFSEWGSLLLQSGMRDEARKALGRAWELNPRIVQVAHGLATLYAESGDERKASEMRACAARLVDREARMRAAQKRLQIDPHDHSATLALARMETDDGNLTDALRYAQALLRERPDDRDALGLLARIYAVGGKPEMAEAVEQHMKALPAIGSPVRQAAVLGTSAR